MSLDNRIVLSRWEMLPVNLQMANQNIIFMIITIYKPINYNLIILIMESWSNDQIGALGASPSATRSVDVKRPAFFQFCFQRSTIDRVFARHSGITATYLQYASYKFFV